MFYAMLTLHFAVMSFCNHVICIPVSDRRHVIDCLPNLWMLDGVLVTAAEREQVQRFFKSSEVLDRPVRHKLRPLTQSKFIPSRIRNLSRQEVLGENNRSVERVVPLRLNTNLKLGINCNVPFLVRFPLRLDYVCYVCSTSVGRLTSVVRLTDYVPNHYVWNTSGVRPNYV
eukprot:sb/3472161/